MKSSSSMLLASFVAGARMFERYSETARRVIFFARYEASMFGAAAIDTEHLLLAIARESQGLLQSLAPSAGLDRIRQMVEQEVETRERVPASIDLPFSEAAKHALNSAVREADHLANQTITPQHMLLGLLREEGSVAQRILAELGVSLEAAVQAAISGSEAQSHPPSSHIPGRITGQAVANADFAQVFRDAIEEASLLLSPSARPEHILLAMLRDENSRAARILREAGADLNAIRQKLKEQKGS